MSSGRSARLPPTPINASNAANVVSRHVVDVHASPLGHNGGARPPPPTSQPIAIPAAAPAAATVSNDAIAVTASAVAASLPRTLAPELAQATSQVLCNMSEHERQIILDALRRDEQFRRVDEQRIG